MRRRDLTQPPVGPRMGFAHPPACSRKIPMSEIDAESGTCPLHAPEVPRPYALSAADAPQLTCYQVDPRAAPIIPGRRDRAWMDATSDHYAYRCLPLDRKSTRLNSSHPSISYAVFCL